MPFLIGLALKLGIAPRFAKAAVIAALIALLIALLGVGKCSYDKRLIETHDAKQDAANAKADRKADTKAAEQRRVDDARATTETAEIKEAVNAEIDPAARRAAYYECVRKLQQARRDQRPADC